MPKYQIFIDCEHEAGGDTYYRPMIYDVAPLTEDTVIVWQGDQHRRAVKAMVEAINALRRCVPVLDPAACAELLGIPAPGTQSLSNDDETGTPAPADHDYQKCEAEWRNARDQLAAIRAAVAKHMRIDPSDNTAKVAVSALEFWFNAADVAERNGQQDRESNRKLQQENQNLRNMIDGLGRQLGKETQAANAEREACAKAAEPAPAAQQSPSPAGSPPPRQKRTSCGHMLGADSVVIDGCEFCAKCVDEMATAIASDRAAKVTAVPPASTTDAVLAELRGAVRLVISSVSPGRVVADDDLPAILTQYAGTMKKSAQQATPATPEAPKPATAKTARDPLICERQLFRAIDEIRDIRRACNEALVVLGAE